ncbi:MAG TPA: thiamine pyrophosphate-binding protein, partial [Acidimicrobiaceae bacterium]|nr:thiamine pyrophosphate-binding protein [Acidimicrobiaceae bacterium]
FFDDLAKWVVEVDSADDLPRVVEAAFTVAMTGRPGPVVVSLPEDVLREVATTQPGPPVQIDERPPSVRDVDAVNAVLAAAERPVLLVGGGGWTTDGRMALSRLATRQDLPVVVTFRRHDLFDNTDDHYVGEAGVGMPPAVRRTLVEADVILAVGARFGE